MALTSNSAPAKKPQFLLGRPEPTDGSAVHALISRCPPLDENSMYCNLLQCTYFAETSATARRGDRLVGFVSGLRVPQRPESLFVWQVAVAEDARGSGLGRQLILHILARAANRDLRRIETTVTPANAASRAMFLGLAKQLGAPLEESVQFERQQHFDGHHDDEMLMQIGPFSQPPARQ